MGALTKRAVPVPGTPGDENAPTPKKPKSDPFDTLLKPFKIPMKHSRNPQRTARKITNYREVTEDEQERDSLRDVTNNKGDFPVFKPKDSQTVLVSRFKTPLRVKPDGYGVTPPPLLGTKKRLDFAPRPLHDPSGEFAIVLYDPTVDDKPTPKIPDVTEIDLPSPPPSDADTSTESNTPPPTKKAPSLAAILGITTEKKKEHPKVPVVIDPRLAKILRPHQVEGVKFLYRCTTGMVMPNANGCIMADEMGLGKTLQCIALMWTLLRQSPEGKGGVISKCVIVCPASLVKNWANELVKWLGKDTITPLAVDGKASKAQLVADLGQWAQATGRQVVRPVLIIAYETLRRYTDVLRGCDIGLLLCDEGHRLKNGESLTFTALDALNCKRRVILSGTPIQNDLSEYFSLLSFANPGLLGSRLEFRKNYELDILRGRDSDATDDEVVKGEQKLKELGQLVSPLIIRRTNDILSKYLPVKYEHVVFCELSDFQKSLYNRYTDSKTISRLLKGKGAQPLKAVDVLKKLCTHPDLLDLPADIDGSEDCFPEDFVPKHKRGRDREIKSWYSGKFMVLERMLARIRAETNDKIVLISNYTTTLDLIERMCMSRRYGVLRLDGTMAINKRQKLVDQFNDPDGNEFIFLLSSKAGGCGLNLIGANRLILMDPDWNPASDQQALARVWRDGQKKDCFVYRFIATGSIEEKIFQRQSMKQSLSSCVVDENEDVERLFSFDNLRQLFSYNNQTLCDTHDTFKCKRCKDDHQVVKAPAMLYGDATTWNHFRKPELKDIQDLLLRQELEHDVISFVFQYISH